MLLTRAPLYSWYCYHFLVRLACVRHAASVDSEPGSNSRLKPDVSTLLTEVREVSTVPALLEAAGHSYLVRMIKPNLIASHDWHVQPICQRSLRVIRLSGALWIEAQAVTPGCPRTCCARRISALLPHPPAFLREPSKIIEILVSLSSSIFSSLEAASNSWLAVSSPGCGLNWPEEEEIPSQKHRAAQNIKERPARKRPSR